jgi:ornithine cyclodeaminase/alanine dehydrogenase-like protein (mu-crystallin family)
MDAEQLTALRTGATSGLATDLLARRSASVAVIIGAGKQGATQLEGICAVRPIAVAYVIDNDAKKAASFAETMTAALAVRVIPAGKTDVLREADIICTATTSTAPLFSHDIIKAGAHINAIGAFRPDMQEVPPETVRSAKVIVDHLASCLEEAGDLIQPIRNGVITRGHLYAELGQIVSGEKRGRVSEDEITLFKSVGNAVQDLAAAGAAVAHASEHQLGAEIPF